MENDATRLDLIFVDMQKTLFKRLLRIVGDIAIAEELTHEAYLRARRAIEATVPQNIEAFLWTTARNLAFDHIRREKVRSRGKSSDNDFFEIENIADEKASLEEHLIHKEHVRLFREALEKLPLRAQNAWFLSRMQAWPYPKIAAHLGVSPNTVFNDIKMVMAVLYSLRAKLER
jgi:RNA polymerase sigma factor (sigma-70 family)